MRGICEASIIIILIVNNIACEETSELFYPVLAPPKSSRAIVTERAKEFPLLKLLARGSDVKGGLPSDDIKIVQPVYVQVSILMVLDDLRDHLHERVYRDNLTVRLILSSSYLYNIFILPI